MGNPTGAGHCKKNGILRLFSLTVWEEMGRIGLFWE
jgi:hypothetical protein